MRAIFVLADKELRTSLGSPASYVVAAVFVALSGASFSLYIIGSGYADTSIRGFVDAAQVLVLLFSVLVAMRLISEEQRTGTWELMLTAPVREIEVVLGKFIGAFLTLALILVLTLYFPLLLAVFGDPDFGPIFTSYLGLFLLSGASLAVGLFASALTSSQTAAAAIASGILVALWSLGSAAQFGPVEIGRILEFLSLSGNFSGFTRGVIDSRSVIYFLSVNTLFLFMTARFIEAKRGG